MAKKKSFQPRLELDDLDTVLNSIEATLEQDDLPPWQQPWSTDGPAALPLRHNGIPYQGLNVISLLAVAQRSALVCGT